MRFLVLNDDRCDSEKLCSRHGFSLYGECEDKKFLFDVGQDDSFLKNAQTLGIDLNVDYIFLSHGHYDHTDGLKFFQTSAPIICHPNCLTRRISKRSGKYNGIPFKKEEFESKFKVIYSAKPYKINAKMMFLGEIMRKNAFECKNFPSILENGEEDTVIDDSGLVIKSDKGLIIITGCGHSGICNTIEYAKEVVGEEKIYAVIGGFHLKEVDNQTQKTAEFMIKNKVENVFLGHCTSDIVIDYFKDKCAGLINIETLSTGKEIIL